MGPRRRDAHGGRVLRLALWTPDAQAPWLRALRPHLEREHRLAIVAKPPDGAVDADLHLYHLAGDPRHGFVFRALLDRPGLVLLEEWDLHRLVHAETRGRGDERAWRALARRASGDTGAFVAELVDRGVAGEMLPLLLPLAEAALDAALGVVAFTADTRARVAALRPGLPLGRVPLPLLAGPEPPPDRAAARVLLGIAPDRALVAVLVPQGGLARARLESSVAPLRAEAGFDLRGVPAAGEPDREGVLAAADVLVALDHPSRGRLEPALGPALGAGVATLVTAGSTAAIELPEGVVARVAPGDTEAAELRALVRRLARDEALRARMGALARAHVAVEGDPARAAASLVALARASLAHAAAATPALRLAALPSAALDEVRWAARSTGLADAPGDVAALVAGLFAPR